MAVRLSRYMKNMSVRRFIIYMMHGNQQCIRWEIMAVGEEALEDCEGYGSEEIMRKAIAASKKVIAGEASWERDSCLFYESQFSYPLCAAILRCALQKDG